MNGTITQFSGPQTPSSCHLANASGIPLRNACPNNQDVAREVAVLFDQGKQGKAVALLNYAKEGQPVAVQKALDRMVSANLQYTIIASNPQLLQTVTPSPVEVGTAIRQINEAGNNPPEMPNTTGLTDQQKFDVYSSIVQIRGNQASQDDLANGNSVIVGLRSENSTLANNGQGVYDDRIAVISRDADGTVHVEEFNRVSTEPSAQYDANLANHPDNSFRRAVGEDVTGDGVLDQGRLATSQTIQMHGTSHPNPSSAGGTVFALRPTQQAVAQGQGGVERFTAGNGYVDTTNPAAVSDLNDSFKIHSGSRNNTDSAGCTTIHPDDYGRFETSVTRDPAQINWNYVLTEVSS
jgi:hypothetical protein